MSDKLVVWIVELYERELPDGDIRELYWFTGSTIEKAIAEVHRTLIEDRWEYKEDNPWWWLIGMVEVDSSDNYLVETYFLDWHGDPIDYQPLDGYNVEYRTHEQDCCLCTPALKDDASHVKDCTTCNPVLREEWLAANPEWKGGIGDA